MSAYSYLSYLECSECGSKFDTAALNGVCTSCNAPLLCRYDLDGIRSCVDPTVIARRAPTLWRYHELLPVSSPQAVVTLGEGMTPLLRVPRLGAALALPSLMLKDESLLPTGTFKARGAAAGVSRATELGTRYIAMPTNGNAGAAWAAYAARAGISAAIAMPADAPVITQAECVISGANLYVVDGLIGDAAAALRPLVRGEDTEYLDVSTLREPYRLEGKKTIGIEIVEQLGWRLPDVIVCPTGGGVGLIGIHKAIKELLELGWTSGPQPRMVAVQAAGCAPIVRAFEVGSATVEPWIDARTLAFGITVPNPLGGRLILDVLRETGGTAIAVPDDGILAAQRTTAELEGCFICPEGAAAVHAVELLRQSGWLGAGETVVVLNTGAGIKYPELVKIGAPRLALGEVVTFGAAGQLSEGGRGSNEKDVDVS